MLTPRPTTPSAPETRLARLGAVSARHPWRFVVAWLVLSAAAVTVAIAGVGGGSLFSRLSTGDPSVPGEAQDAAVLLDAAEGGPTRLLQLRGVDLRDETVVSALTAATQALATVLGVTSVTSPLTVPGGPASAAAAPLLAAGSTPASTGLLTIVELDPQLPAAAKDTVGAAVDAGFTRLGSAAPGAGATTGSVDELVSTITGQVEQDLRLGEGIALPVSFVVMVLVFGGLVAAGMPTLGAIASILGALASLYGFSYLVDLDVSVVNVVTLLGLGLSIDYGLLFVSRFREELRAIVTSPGSAGGTRASRSHRGITREQVVDATARTMARAGRTIVFSALTVAIALGGLLIFEAQIMRAIGAAGVSVVVVALLAALTLVPALCALGARALMRGHRDLAPEDGLFSRLARFVQKRPVPVIVLTTAVLVGLSLPAFSMRLTSSGRELLPQDNPVRVFFSSLARDFPFASGPEVSVAAQGSLAEVTRWAEGSVARLPGVLSTRTEQRSPQIVAVSVYVDGGAQDQASRDVVTSIRENRPAFATWVAGPAARLADFTTSMAARAPFAGAVVALGTLALLFLLTGSLVIPLKA
ncbi:MAG TPA: MMPL family transporter, partial [Candidatus Lustribacter sp.]|nr:MMPL family transporter [Candidatus Lustribacter sp.]